MPCHSDLSFSIDEFTRRLDRTYELMDKVAADLLIVDEIESMTYLCGFGVSENLWRACIIPRHARPLLVIRSLDMVPARERCWFEETVPFRDWDDPIVFLVSLLRQRGLDKGRIALDYYSQSMPHGRFELLRSLLPNAEFADLGRGLWELRLRKSAAELGYLRQAAAVVDAAMASAIAAVQKGGNQRDVSAAAAATYMKLGADNGFVGPITTGHDWDSLHGHISSKDLKPGDIVHIELVPRVRGYSARLMRSVVVGRPSIELQKVASELVNAQDEQLEAMKPGALASDIDKIVRQGIVASGLRSSYHNITGYTVGLLPSASQRSSDFTRTFTPAANWRLEEGMTFHMYVSARGLAFSETIVVNSRGAERLTKTERKLFSTG